MDLYPWIVFLHVVGVLLFFIAHGTSMAVGFRLKRERDPARVRALLELTDRKSLLALRGVGRQSEAESVRFHGRRVTRVGPEVKHGPEGWGPRNKGCERRTWALPDVSGGGERHDRFGVVVGEGVVEPRIEGRFARRVGAGMHAPPLLPEPEMAQEADLKTD